MALKRIQKELLDQDRDPDHSVSWRIIDENDRYHAEGRIIGPDGTPYEGGIFFLNIKIPTDYPFKPPKVNLITKIFHLDVRINSGELCCYHFDITGD